MPYLSERRRRAVLGIMSVIIVVAIGATAWHNLTRVSAENDPVAYYIGQAAPMYAALPRLPAPMGTPDGKDRFTTALHGALSNAQVVGAVPAPEGLRIVLPASIARRYEASLPRVSRAMHAALIEQAAVLMGLRLDALSPGPYLAFRAAHGATLDRASYERHYPGTLDYSARIVMGERYTGTETPATIFEVSYPLNLPDAVATGDGLAIGYGLACDEYTDADLSEAALGYVGWSGGLTLAYGPTTVTERTLSEIVATHGAVPLATVGMIAYYADRPARPLCLRFVWDPGTGGWALDRIIVSNITETEAASNACPIF